MTLECIVIPAWVLIATGIGIGLFGVHLAREYMNEEYSPWWKCPLSALLLVIGFCAVFAVLLYYIVPIILPLLPCITVIP